MVGYMSERFRPAKSGAIMKDKLEFISPKSTVKILKRNFWFLTSAFVHLC
jgi:hypothetical protein